MTPRFHTALVTPLQADDSLHAEGLETALAQQLAAGIDGLLIAGTMGLMQLLPDATYRALVAAAARQAGGRAELLVGAGDASFARTAERIAFLNDLPIDGVVVLAPYLVPFPQDELVDYYTALAGLSKKPLFLYDLPGLTRTKLERDTVLAIAKHPNVAGIKCSDEPGYARQLRDLAPDGFRVILAAPTMMDIFLRAGFPEHLDGIFSLAPRQTVALGRAAAARDWDQAALLQEGLNRMLRLLLKDGIWKPTTALLNALGVPGRFKPRPHRDWNAQETAAFLAEPETVAVLEFLKGDA